ncbi:hypothetical protein BHF71_00620 [Vulcanibacillus modesticaldus]|uniref:Exopolyphosphatase n=1 Tax=Vulcanibacillus modesticaldus TaxID=337097 RepID=A0A1D2YXF9_9BACI|nr:bifunctional oligoribonuclease/PAP phosphatase NrnA [Vulcanibacillus modesticaldus]OEG00445.1 hypothetical protein BHF71_00620 [Vulcanibacillus modesticaldus]
MESYRKMLTNAANFINDYDNFLIVSHVNPDGDTISSSLAMAHLLKSLGKSFTLVNENVIPQKYSFLTGANEISLISEMDENEKFSYVITIDVADKKRAGEIDYLLTSDVKLLNIDHHPTNDKFGDVNLVLPTAAATAEVVYDLVKEMNAAIDKELATYIYTGLLTDTGGFRYSNTTSKVMRIAAELLDHDISPSNIAEITLETMTKSFLNLLKIALDKLEVVLDGRIAWTTLTLADLSDDNNSDNTEGIVNYTRNIEGVEVGILFKEVKDNQFKVSIRSKRFIDVGDIAKSFGGGGHMRAAGFTYEGTLESIKEKIVNKIRQTKGWQQLEKESDI